MKASLLFASWLPSLSAAVTLPALPAVLEVDIIFPRNETYARVDNFPVILALQNAPLAWDFGFHVSWSLRNLSKLTGSNFVDSESILQPNLPVRLPAPADTFFIVNSTNDLDGPGTYQLSWGIALSENCTRNGDFITHTIGAGLSSGQVVFTIADGGKAVDLTDGGPCPLAGGVVNIQSNLTGCAHVDNTGIQANPCNIAIDDSLAQSLSSQLPQITGSTSTKATATKTTTPTSGTGTGGVSKTSSSTTTSATNNAPRGSLQTAAAVLAGAAGLCAMLV
ncbi:hypothetical protein GQ53DRAFT_868447 [Thozetella sp. PMI_491]|nr:hypothetical protein GQ53DRAFT_868447 [Thozetella sp. PMI_491]